MNINQPPGFCPGGTDRPYLGPQARRIGRYRVIVPPRATITNKAKDMESKTIYEVPGLKVSAKMRKSIEILERNYRILNKRFFVERNEFCGFIS